MPAPGTEAALELERSRALPQCFPDAPPERRRSVRGEVGAGAPRELSMRAPREALDALFGLAPAAFLRRVRGRETFAWTAEDGSFVVKRFRGADAREWWYETLHLHRPRSAARREAQNLRELHAAGFPVPRALAWFEERAAIEPLGAARSAVVLERIAHATDLAAFAERHGWSASRGFLLEVAELAARLHARGWYHRDLYLQHAILERASSGRTRVVLLDCGRARRERRPRSRWFVKDVAALRHSWPKGLDEEAWRAFLERYLDARGIDDVAARARFERAVEAKRARLAAHLPRKRDPDGGRPSRA